MHPTATESPRQQMAQILARHYAELAGTAAKPAPSFSVVRALRQMMEPQGLRSGYERDICAGASLSGDAPYDGHRVHLPWGAIATRDLTITPATGGYLVGDAVPAATDALRPWSVAVRAGVTTFPNLRENLLIPRTAGDVAGAWLAVDGESAITPADPVVGQTVMTPKTWGAIVEFSTQFLRQSDQAETYVRRELLRVAGRALDAAILGGAGSAGEPLGIVNTVGVGSVSGTSFEYADALAMREAVATAGANDPAVTWVASPAVREVLAVREVVADTGKFVWSANTIDGQPAYVTPDAPAATLFLADWSQVAVGLWGAGIRVEVNPYQTFAKGIVAMRVLLDCDVAILQRGAVCISPDLS